VSQWRSEAIAFGKENRGCLDTDQADSNDIAEDHELLRCQRLAITEIEVTNPPVPLPTEFFPTLQLNADDPARLLAHRSPEVVGKELSGSNEIPLCNQPRLAVQEGSARHAPLNRELNEGLSKSQLADSKRKLIILGQTVGCETIAAGDPGCGV